LIKDAILDMTIVWNEANMLTRERHYTIEEFREIARLPENENRQLELDGGVIIDMAASRPINTIVAGRIIHFLNAHVIPRDLGYITVPDGGYKLAPNTSRQPDAAFVSKKRVPEVPKEFDLAPDLAVEVVSPSEDVLKKVNEYLRAGTQIVWAVYADEKRVYVFTQDEKGNLHGEPKELDDTLSGGDILPDFELPVKDIFPE
jgi:Uma2 family endonuclease